MMFMEVTTWNDAISYSSESSIINIDKISRITPNSDGGCTIVVDGELQTIDESYERMRFTLARQIGLHNVLTKAEIEKMEDLANG